MLVVYLGANLLFASGYLAIGDGIEEARPGNFADAFFFSVQTMATIGYGKMAPRGIAANLLVTGEALVGLLGLALVTGLVFAKFSRPTARVIFSRNAVITTFDGVPSLLVRMANERGNQIAEAQAHLVLLRNRAHARGGAGAGAPRSPGSGAATRPSSPSPGWWCTPSRRTARSTERPRRACGRRTSTSSPP